MSLAVGPAIARFFGGFLVSWFDWRATFFSTAILGLATLIAAIPRFVETLPKEDRRSPDLAGMARKYIELLHNRLFIGYSLTIAFLTGTFQTFIVAAPIVMIDQMDVSPELFGFYVMTVPSSFILASFVSARLSGRVHLDKMIAEGKMPTVKHLYDFLDKMAETFHDAHKAVMNRIGIKELIKDEFLYLEKK